LSGGSFFCHINVLLYRPLDYITVLVHRQVVLRIIAQGIVAPPQAFDASETCVEWSVSGSAESPTQRLQKQPTGCAHI